ncbi:uncharacterized protein BKA55DRAFT_379952 [Fusarium redolens]|uniref:Uncharacterized protein n=1 Tax=Fusarium redolens TaxID=48865 RepID=A0A9P9K438_FUSRE|nr:uncharacterized protein BKA55DRAFT_379952 [Fusarium redolens]KAH7248562.1 hypothetical protein BKA55DRAFT_379952 [Fusarium redolens]
MIKIGLVKVAQLLNFKPLLISCSPFAPNLQRDNCRPDTIRGFSLVELCELAKGSKCSHKHPPQGHHRRLDEVATLTDPKAIRACPRLKLNGHCGSHLGLIDKSEASSSPDGFRLPPRPQFLAWRSKCATRSYRSTLSSWSRPLKSCQAPICMDGMPHLSARPQLQVKIFCEVLLLWFSLAPEVRRKVHHRLSMNFLKRFRRVTLLCRLLVGD